MQLHLIPYSLHILFYLHILSASTNIGNIQHIKCQSDLSIPPETISEMFPMTIHLQGQYHHCVPERTKSPLITVSVSGEPGLVERAQ